MMPNALPLSGRMIDQKSVQLNKKNTVSVIPAAPNIDLDSDIYAINWFDLKRPWLYEFYNQVAFPHVKEVGGQVHFKGLVSQKIKGPDEMDRQMLLIVKYPGADQFLKMISNKTFLFKSVLRIKAVDYFTFGFTKRMGSGPDPLSFPQVYDGNLKYLSFHFQTKKSPSQSLYLLEEIVSNLGLGIHYMGYKAALVGRSAPEKKLRTQPFLMDGIALISAESSETFEVLINYDGFQKLCAEHLTNNLYRIDRSI